MNSRIRTIALVMTMLISSTGGLSVALASTLGTTSPSNVADPPLNATPLYSISGDYTYVAAGAAMRNLGNGSIDLTWTGTAVKAFLIWGIINTTTTKLDVGSINGHAITGTFQATDASPCWGNGNISVFAADVTAYVNNGVNKLTGFATGLTTGEDPWDGNVVAPLADGATLIVVVPSATPHQVYIYTGAFTEPSSGNPLTSIFNHGAADATTVQTTFFVLDGQLSGNYAQWNGVTIDSNAFPGSDNKSSTTTWSFGNLSDTKTYTVPETFGATTDNASIGSNFGDCLTWAAQALSIPSTAPIAGVPQFSLPIYMVTALAMLSLVVIRKKMHILPNAT